MPYKSQNIYVAETSIELDINYMLQKGLILKNSPRTGTLFWKSSFGTETSISFLSKFTQDNPHLRLSYDLTTKEGSVKKFDYSIDIVCLESNLGRGLIPYFICPITHCRCRKLYLMHSNCIFVSRQAFGKRMMYQSQIVSKYWRHNTRYFKLCDKLAKLREKRIYHKYLDIETRRHKKMRFLKRQIELYDNLRSSSLRTILGKQFLKAMKIKSDRK